MPDNEQITSITRKLDDSQNNLVITIAGEALMTLSRLSGKMKNVSTPKEAVEIAIELLLKAEDKDIALMQQGKITSTYSLWR